MGAGSLRAIELVGVAASGKSTLFRALAERSSCVAPVAAFGAFAHLRFGFAHAARLLPAWLASQGRWLSEKELRSMNYVAGWRHAVERWRPGEAALVFDHGPLFRLARLEAFGPRLVASPSFCAWSQAAVRSWAPLLDAVVWLDAPDELLVARIESRAEPHRTRGGPAADTQRFLARYRETYAGLLEAFEAAGGPSPRRIDTSREAPAAIADRLIADFGL